MLIQSKYMGTCKGCGLVYAKGTWIDWTKEKGGFHKHCVVFTPEELVKVYQEDFRVKPEVIFLGEIEGRYHFRRELRTQTVVFSVTKSDEDYQVISKVKRAEPLYPLPEEE